jgi:hypothetical protein
MSLISEGYPLNDKVSKWIKQMKGGLSCPPHPYYMCENENNNNDNNNDLSNNKFNKMADAEMKKQNRKEDTKEKKRFQRQKENKRPKENRRKNSNGVYKAIITARNGKRITLRGEEAEEHYNLIDRKTEVENLKYILDNEVRSIIKQILPNSTNKINKSNNIYKQIVRNIKIEFPRDKYYTKEAIDNYIEDLPSKIDEILSIKEDKEKQKEEEEEEKQKEEEEEEKQKEEETRDANLISDYLNTISNEEKKRIFDGISAKFNKLQWGDKSGYGESKTSGFNIPNKYIVRQLKLKGGKSKKTAKRKSVKKSIKKSVKKSIKKSVKKSIKKSVKKSSKNKDKRLGKYKHKNHTHKTLKAMKNCLK